MRMRRLYRELGVIALFLSFPATGDRQPATGNDLACPDVKQFLETPDGPVVRLPDGREYRLMRLPETGTAPGAAGETRRRQESSTVGIRRSPPDVVDNRRFHGRLQDQGPRNTCVSFSVTAAVEGAYHRLDPVRLKDLKLSEQWANHVQKMAHLDYKSQPPPSLPSRENELGCWGGSECTYLLSVLQRIGQTDAKAMPYNPNRAYEDTEEPGDDPRFRQTSGPLTQHVVDDFNLDPANLPLTALAEARYRPKEVTLLAPEQVRDVSYLERVIAAGYDVVVDFALVQPEGRTVDGAWVPGDPKNPSVKPREWGQHSMLFIGYNRPKQYFLARNSWGYDRTDGGYTRIGYEYVRQWSYWGGFITTVVDWRESLRPALFLGRWQMNHDGWPGILDIYRLPGIFTSRFLRDQNDQRVGTYFDPTGRAYRVNGVLKGWNLEFYIDFQQPDAPFGALRGTPFQAKLFARDEQTLAGLYSQGGETYGFHATKAPPVPHVAAAAAATPRDACLGRWKLNVEGITGDLYLEAGAGPELLVGRYHETSERQYEVKGSVRDQKVEFQIKFGVWNSFSGRLYSRDRGLMSGFTDGGGKGPYGFTAARQG